MSFKIAVGLGNSGEAYEGTRHNVGRSAVLDFARSAGAAFSFEKYCAAYTAVVSGVRFVLLNGYMNESGINLARVLKFFKADISETVVAYDDITLDLGRVKLADRGSSGGHNGVENIISVCGESFARLKIGIGSKPFKSMDLADFVLQKIPDDDWKILNQEAFPKTRKALELLFSKGMSEAQNAVNRRVQTDNFNYSKQQNEY